MGLVRRNTTLTLGYRGAPIQHVVHNCAHAPEAFHTKCDCIYASARPHAVYTARRATRRRSRARISRQRANLEHLRLGPRHHCPLQWLYVTEAPRLRGVERLSPEPEE